MRILFWGTPEFAVPTLRALTEEGHEVVAVVTQPDRPAGRGRRTQPSPVKEAALEDGLIVLTPARPRGDDFIRRIGALKPDVSVVVAYGHILSRAVLDVPPLGSFNLHASLLPELRGAGPVNWAIIRGYQETGVTIMRMVEAMDAGPILLQVREPIGPHETAGELSTRLSEVGAVAFLEALALLSLGQAEEVEQDHERATFAPKLDRDTGRVDWSRPAAEVGCLIRGVDPTPGAWTTLAGDAVKLFAPVVEEVDVTAAPGTVLEADPRAGVVVAAGQGAVRLGEVQPAGRKRITSAQWVNGRGVQAGQSFE